jgi:hypothetical protein
MSGQSDHGHKILRVIEQLRRNFTVVNFNSRANVWRAKKESDKTIADYNEAFRLDPKYALATTTLLGSGRPVLMRLTGDGEKAVESVLKSCELSEWKGAYHIGTLAAASLPKPVTSMGP